MVLDSYFQIMAITENLDVTGSHEFEDATDSGRYYIENK